MVMFEDIVICFAPTCRAPLGAPSGGSETLNSRYLNITRGTHFGFGWSNSGAEISVLAWFRGENIVFFDVQDLTRQFVHGQLFT